LQFGILIFYCAPWSAAGGVNGYGRKPTATAASASRAEMKRLAMRSISISAFYGSGWAFVAVVAYMATWQRAP
jgi:hypothetical protein